MHALTTPDQKPGTLSIDFSDAGVERDARTRLPEPLTSFVGRQQEVDGVLALLKDRSARLVTLIGPGGVGKTRLALRVAAEIAAAGDREVRFVALAPITDTNIIVTTIGLSVGITEATDGNFLERLVDAFAGRDMLLVLDNFERLVDAGPILSELLSRSPGLTLLVTTRALLRLSGEFPFAVRPLDLPVPTSTVEQILQSSAVHLFIDRIDPQCQFSNGTASPSDLHAVAEICRRLDGLPLAIELAAARTRVFGVQELVERLDSGIEFLRNGPRDAPPRLQSMHEMIAWSYDLLNAEEQALFRVLSIFSGGFTFRSAAELYGQYLESTGGTIAVRPAAEYETLVADLILSLIDQSLVEQYATDDRQPRFTLLETIREYGMDRLTESGEAGLVFELHAQRLAALARSRKPYLISMPKVDTDDPLHREHDNIRAAILWSIEHGKLDLAGWLACGLWPFWYRNGLYTEARDAFERILLASHALNPELHADLLHNAGLNAHLQGDSNRTRALATAALPLYEMLGNQIGIAHCLCLTGLSSTNSDPPRATSDFARAAEILRSLEDIEALSYALDGLGTAMMHEGDLAGAKAAFTESLTITNASDFKRCGFVPLGWAVLAEGDLDLASNILLESLKAEPFRISPFNRACTFRLLGRIALHRGQLQGAADLYHQALSITKEIGAHQEGVQCAAEFAAVAQAHGDSERAVRWLSFDHSQREQKHPRLTPDESSIRECALEQARAALGASEFAAAWDAGSNLSTQDAFGEALAWHPDERAGARPAAGLTRRESQVLRLLATHGTNQDIAGELFLSPRTIESHVASILAKLDVHSRYEAIDMARERGLIPR